MCGWLAVWSERLLQLGWPLCAQFPSFQWKESLVETTTDTAWLLWRMSTSQYLTSHHLHQSYSQRVMCWVCAVAFVCCTIYAWHVTMGYGYALVKCTEMCSDDRTVSWAALRSVNWTGCWAMCFTRADVPVTAGNTSPISVLPFLFHLLSHHTGDALRCTAGTCGLTAHQSQEKLNIVPSKRVIP